MRSSYRAAMGLAACLAFFFLAPMNSGPPAWQRGSILDAQQVFAGQAMPAPYVPKGSVWRGASTHFDFYTHDSELPLTLDEMRVEVEKVYDYVTHRMGAQLEGRVALVIKPPAKNRCGLRGLTKISSPSVNVMADTTTSKEQFLGVLAHEMGHVVELFAYGSRAQGDIVLLEAVATWGAGDYWNQWRGQASFESSVSAALGQGRSIDLDRASLDGLDGDVRVGLGNDCERDLFYTQWAAFVEYLVKAKGVGGLVELQTRPALRLTNEEGEEYLRADFRKVYGAKLTHLSNRWLQERSR